MKKKLILVIVGITVMASVFFGYSVANAEEPKYKDPLNLSEGCSNPTLEIAIRTEAISAYQKLTGKNPIAVSSGGMGDMTEVGYWFAIITTDDKYLLLYSTNHRGSFEIIQSPKQSIVRTFVGSTAVKTMVTTASDLSTAKTILNAVVVNNK